MALALAHLIQLLPIQCTHNRQAQIPLYHLQLQVNLRETWVQIQCAGAEAYGLACSRGEHSQPVGNILKGQCQESKEGKGKAQEHTLTPGKATGKGKGKGKGKAMGQGIVKGHGKTKVRISAQILALILAKDLAR